MKRLEAASLVAREVDPHDGRVCIIRLTDPGRAELASIRTALGIGLEPYLARLTEPDRQALQTAIAVMRRL